MWEQAISAVQNEDVKWLKDNSDSFREFFRRENLMEKGKLSPEALEMHYRHGLFKMFLSKSYGGLEIPLHKGGKWIENAAYLDANWGWLLAIGVGGAYFADYLSPETAQKYFNPPEALVAGSGKPSGNAEKDGDSWQVNGSWQYCSGSEQASMFTAVTRRGGKNLAFVLPIEQAEIIRDWNKIGMQLTCSHSIVAKNAEIPPDNFFDLSGQPRDSSYPLASYPFMLFARACFVPVVTGICKSLWDHASELMESRKEDWQNFQPGRYEYLLQQKKEFLHRNRHLSSHFYKSLRKSWQNHTEGKPVLEKQVSKLGLDLAEYQYTSSAAIIPKLGMQVLEKDHPIQEKWQNLQTAYQHMSFQEY
ncbi:hypothetical protein RM553_17665 [Zunongwangia sp. F363]|uniref:Acyl-CoA dehydrogenase n=1 Tax=Autumnicola tepida TaxID=3075595 RepID=A0ABU3CE94_9FLAO|nr:hypothetical protein [Zunongwangia sp. F363]MDT0644672.1 hypothetical protein [Zunongwangia sp. F363]